MPPTHCLAADLADAVCALLNGEDFSQSFTAVRPKSWLVHYTPDELHTLRVSCVPAATTIDEATRDEDLLTQSVDVLVQKYRGARGDCDPLGRLAEEIRQVFHGRRQLTAGVLTVECVRREFVAGSDSLVAKEHLTDYDTFTAVLRLTFEVVDFGDEEEDQDP